MLTEIPLYLSRLLIPYGPFCLPRSSSSTNLLQVPLTNLIFGSPFFHAATPNYLELFLTLSVFPIHSTLFGATLKHTLSK